MIEATIPPMPDFLRRTAEREAELSAKRTRRIDDERATARACREAQERARKKTAQERKARERAKKRAVLAYNKLFQGRGAAAGSKAMTPEQTLIWNELLARERQREKGEAT